MKLRHEMGEDGLIPSTTQFGFALGDAWRCSRCGHMQLVPMPSAAILDTAYEEAASEDYVDEEAGQRASARRALTRIEQHAPGRGALLDLGCWVGFLLAEARARGWRTLGVEPSEFAAAYAREQLGLDVVRAGLLEAELPLRAFDAATMGDVIEHLPDPQRALARVRELLKPGGVLWLAAPDAGSLLARSMGRRWWSVIPTHVQYFTRDSLSTLLRRCGFEVVEISTAPTATRLRAAERMWARPHVGRGGGRHSAFARATAGGVCPVPRKPMLWRPPSREHPTPTTKVEPDWASSEKQSQPRTTTYLPR